jgi:hypothetical protein
MGASFGLELKAKSGIGTGDMQGFISLSAKRVVCKTKNWNKDIKRFGRQKLAIADMLEMLNVGRDLGMRKIEKYFGTDAAKERRMQQI